MKHKKSFRWLLTSLSILCATEGTNSQIISTVAGTGVAGFSGDGGPAMQAQLNFPRSVAVDSAGGLYIADTDNNRIRKVESSGVIITVAGTGIGGFSGDGGPATQAQLAVPDGVTLDAVGNLYIADVVNSRVRKVDPAGTISTVAGTGFFGFSGDGGPATQAQLAQPVAVAVDASGNLYIGDSSINNRVRKVDASGIITTVAGTGQAGFSGDGGLATQAQLNDPNGLSLDAAGNLYIADTENHRVRRVDALGIITTVAGTGVAGFSGDGGPATQAELNKPFDVALDAAGNMYMTDIFNHRVRKVTFVTVDVAITSVTAPQDGFMPSEPKTAFPATVGSQPVKVSGTISDAAAAVVVNGVSAVVQADGSWTAQNVPLNEGINTITATATDMAGNTASASVEVTLDMDLDGDGIQNNVDGKFHPVSGDPITQFDQPSDDFSDELLGGTTRGKILELGDRTWLIKDELNAPNTDANEGLRIVVGSGAEEAKVQGGTPPCAPEAVVVIDPDGADFVLSCGSLVVQVKEGAVRIHITVEIPALPIIDVMAKVGKDGVLTIEEVREIEGVPDRTLFLRNDGKTPITLIVFGSSVALNVGESRTVRPVKSDIKPGSEPNSINLNSKGVLPVAILSDETFDARRVLAETVVVGDPTVEERVTPVRSGLEDVDGDGRVDMVVFFSMEGIRTVGALDDNSSLAGLIGLTTDNKLIVGLDFVRIVPGASRRAASLLDQPIAYALYEAYPNPFNPSTTIQYNLPEPSFVRLAVYDMLGREVALLVQEEKQAGRHLVKFDAGGLPSGIYVCRLQASTSSRQAGKLVQTKKLLLMR